MMVIINLRQLIMMVVVVDIVDVVVGTFDRLTDLAFRTEPETYDEQRRRHNSSRATLFTQVLSAAIKAPGERGG